MLSALQIKHIGLWEWFFNNVYCSKSNSMPMDLQIASGEIDNAMRAQNQSSKQPMATQAMQAR